MVRSKTHQLLKNRETLLLNSLNESVFEPIDTSKDVQLLETSLGVFKFEEVATLPASTEAISNHIIFIDKDKLDATITVRKKIEGDYFYPVGMFGKKKVSKYFKDQKLSLIDKEKTLILCSHDKIVWVVSHRLDDRFKVSKETKHILKITYTP